MDTIVLGLSLFVASAGAALNLVQFAQVRALRRESRAMAEALSRLSAPGSLHRPSTSRRLSEARLFDPRRTSVKLAALPPAEAERSRAMIQVLQRIRPGDEPPEELLERHSGFWPTHPGPSDRA
jgi:hypothetical protein